jgi:hypothetical protein
VPSTTSSPDILGSTQVRLLLPNGIAMLTDLTVQYYRSLEPADLVIRKYHDKMSCDFTEMSCTLKCYPNNIRRQELSPVSISIGLMIFHMFVTMHCSYKYYVVNVAERNGLRY